MLVDGMQRDMSFQRKTGYVQQQDLHLPTSTVREALNFSALLRQPASIPRREKVAYVEEVIKMLDMQEYADAGLQRLSILRLIANGSFRLECGAAQKAHYSRGTSCET
jgi:ABC-type multidrug transport system ATPase subunit